VGVVGGWRVSGGGSGVVVHWRSWELIGKWCHFFFFGAQARPNGLCAATGYISNHFFVCFFPQACLIA
jgi:hypothetical protein